jgi:hypothetical protein
MTDRLDIEGVLAGHSYELEHRRGSICLCGFVPDVDPATLATQQDYHRAHVAAVLREQIAAWLGSEGTQAALATPAAVAPSRVPGEECCTCNPAEVENGVCVLCGKRFPVGDGV